MSEPTLDPTWDEKAEAAAACQRFIAAAKDFDNTWADGDIEYDVAEIAACLSQVTTIIDNQTQLLWEYVAEMWPHASHAINDHALGQLQKSATGLAALSGVCTIIKRSNPEPIAVNGIKVSKP